MYALDPWLTGDESLKFENRSTDVKSLVIKSAIEILHFHAFIFLVCFLLLVCFLFCSVIFFTAFSPENQIACFASPLQKPGRGKQQAVKFKSDSLLCRCFSHGVAMLQSQRSGRVFQEN